MDNKYTTVACIKDGPVARVSFCRPEIHNAFNDTLIFEMTDLFTALKADKSLRVVVLTGEGKSFCAGADLNWMRRVKEYSFEKNLEEALALADLFYLIYTLPLPVIGRINGAAIGGGTGFVAVCDIAVAAESAKFSFSEVKIGVVPACIGPYVIRKIGA
ncbi:MAG: enoyl-CoA hydratase-related protein, partial [candidate division Zixibacteria bacterium]|nr:enoyl-CoA hydratase-related protein [candidate division Zixibacteria bacterium]